jgi:hypothetical protein
MPKMQRTQKLPTFFSSPNDDISENNFLCTDLCTETSSFSCYSQLSTISEPNADTDIVVLHTISEDKKIEKMKVLEEGHLNETINVNNLTTLVSEYPSDKSNFSETLPLQIKH